MISVFAGFRQVEPEGALYLDITQVTSVAHADPVCVKSTARVMCAGVEYHIFGVAEDVMNRLADAQAACSNIIVTRC